MTEAIAKVLNHENATRQVRQFQKLSLSMSANEMIQRSDKAEQRLVDLFQAARDNEGDALESLRLGNEILGLNYAFREKFDMTMHEYRVQQVFRNE